VTAYADAYQAAYGSAETVAELIPYMLTAFVESDNGFRKARRDREAAPDGDGRRTPRLRREPVPAVSVPPSIAPRDNV
jgi:hypothetical protein